MTVIDFYLARLDEEEQVGKLIQRSSLGEKRRVGLLADCQAKRRIVEMYRTESDLAGRSLHPASDGRLGALADVIQTLAAVYAGHEDWNPDWSVSE